MHEISLAYYEENLNALDDLRESISKMIRGGRVDDYASEKLLTIRRAIEE
jgi:dsDNA-specific endonuclease/ATPase MutS2